MAGSTGEAAMLAERVEAELEERLPELAAGAISQRRLAAELGVARGTLRAILSGRRSVRYSRDFQRSTRRADAAPAPSPVGRCPICRRLIELPCAACQIEADPGPRLFSDVAEGDGLRSELYGQARRRYEILRLKKMAANPFEGLAAAEDDDVPEPTDAELIEIEEATDAA